MKMFISGTPQTFTIIDSVFRTEIFFPRECRQIFGQNRQKQLVPLRVFAIQLRKSFQGQMVFMGQPDC